MAWTGCTKVVCVEVALLVVDDSPDNAKRLIDVVARLMLWTVKDAADDQRALQRLRQSWE